MGQGWEQQPEEKQRELVRRNTGWQVWDCCREAAGQPFSLKASPSDFQVSGKTIGRALSHHCWAVCGAAECSMGADFLLLWLFERRTLCCSLTLQPLQKHEGRPGRCQKLFHVFSFIFGALLTSIVAILPLQCSCKLLSPSLMD